MNRNKLSDFIIITLTILTLASCNGQNHTAGSKNIETSSYLPFSPVLFHYKTDTLYVDNAPTSITRSIIEDKSGNIWFATFDGIFKYDGRTFDHITKDVSDSRFFSVLEDREGNMWFGSIGAGVFKYDGTNFQNFTTDDGLVNNEIVCIYEDKSANIWFGANGGVSIYDGQSFQNYMMQGDSIIRTGKGAHVPNLQRPTNEVNSIIEDDNTGRFWLGTRGHTYTFDGKSFSRISEQGMPLQNIRSIIQDQENNIWLGGNGGLWRYDGAVFDKVSDNFVGYIYEDDNGHIWTSSDQNSGWALSQYDQASLKSIPPSPTHIKTGEGMFFGILEDSEGIIWVGTLNGVYRYHEGLMTLIRKTQS